MRSRSHQILPLSVFLVLLRGMVSMLKQKKGKRGGDSHVEKGEKHGQVRFWPSWLYIEQAHLDKEEREEKASNKMGGEGG